VRPVQMLANDIYGGHIVLEININSKWVVFDPLYNLSFRRADGQLASFDEVGARWDAYKSQVPANYNFEYAYAGKRYTNWSKLPLVGTVMKGAINLFKGSRAAETFSLRVLFLNPKKILFFSSLILYGICLFALLNKKYFKISLARLIALPKLRPQGKLKPAMNA
jgi:hypothetical protein